MSKYRNEHVWKRMEQYKINCNLAHANFKMWDTAIINGSRPLKSWVG